MQAKIMKTNLLYEWTIPHPSAKSIMVLVCPFTSVNIQIKWVDFDSVRASTPSHWQTPLFIKSCSRIGSANHTALRYWWSTLQWSFNPLEAIFTVDLDSDYYSSRWKDINSFWVFIGTFTTFVGGDSDH
jgi:hypothetical protein